MVRSQSPSSSGSSLSSTSRSRSRSRSVSRSNTRSSSSASSRSGSPPLKPSKQQKRSRSSSGGSEKSFSSGSSKSKGKKKLKTSDRKVSTKMAQRMSSGDEIEEEQEVGKKKKVAAAPPAKKAASTAASAASKKKKQPKKSPKAKVASFTKEEGEVSDDNDSNKEFDDGLDDDLIGDEEDRNNLENMTEREREEELFKRAENRENLKKRFEIEKKLKRQQKLKGVSSTSLSGGNKARSSPSTALPSDEDEDGESMTTTSTTQVTTMATSKPMSEDVAPPAIEEKKASPLPGSDSDSDLDIENASKIFDHKERSHDRRKNLDAMKYDKKSNALSELKAKRQEKERKKDLQKLKEKEKKDSGSDSDSKSKDWSLKRKLKASEIYSDESSSSDDEASTRNRHRSRSRSSTSSSSSSDENSGTERFHKEPSNIQKYIDIQEDLEPVRISRHKLERFVHLPFFKKLVVGCFVRIGIGQNEGKPVYRCVEIIDVCETAKVYTVGRERTNCGLRLKFGKNERVFRLEFISNQTWTSTEFLKWKETCLEVNISLPTHEFVKSKSAEIRKALQHEFTSEDVDKIVAQKERFHRHPVNYAMNKARLMKEKEIAVAEGREEDARSIEKKLADLEERAEELDKIRTSTISSVSLINDRNRKDNVRKAEQAIHNEIKRKKLEGDADNPFKRHKCNPRIVTKNKLREEKLDPEKLLQLTEKEKQEKENKAAAEEVAVQTAAQQAASSTKASSEEKKKKVESKKENKSDLFDAHNFEIEIDVDMSLGPSNPVNVNLKPVNLVQKDTGPSKRSLNLDDYKRRRGLI